MIATHTQLFDFAVLHENRGVVTIMALGKTLQEDSKLLLNQFCMGLETEVVLCSHADVPTKNFDTFRLLDI